MRQTPRGLVIVELPELIQGATEAGGTHRSVHPEPCRSRGGGTAGRCGSSPANSAGYRRGRCCRDHRDHRDVRRRSRPDPRRHIRSSGGQTSRCGARRRREISCLRTAPLLDGYRGRPVIFRSAIRELLVRVARLIDDLPQVAELDLNPVICSGGDDMIVVDAQYPRCQPRHRGRMRLRVSCEPDIR